MHTLLLRFTGPLQAWGLDSKFDVRRSEREPTKSAVIGLLGAALGWKRNQSDRHKELSESLRFGVRVDKEGELLRDFHIAKGEKDSYVTERFYLSDAKFLVGLEGDLKLLKVLNEALQHPYFQIYLGRRSCPPEGRASLGIRSDTSLEDALQDEVILHNYRAYERPETLRFLVEPPPGEDGQYYQKDQVVSFSKERREHVYRPVREKRIPMHYADDKISAMVATNHDPIAVLKMEVEE